MTFKDLNYAKINSVNLLYFIIDKINGYIEESDGNNYLTLVSTDESKDTLKKCEQLWDKIRKIIRSIANNLNIYDEKYVKIKFNSGWWFISKQNAKTSYIGNKDEDNYEGKKYYPRVFLDNCLCKL